MTYMYYGIRTVQSLVDGCFSSVQKTLPYKDHMEWAVSMRMWLLFLRLVFNTCIFTSLGVCNQNALSYA